MYGNGAHCFLLEYKDSFSADLGTVYTFGDGTYGQLGHGDVILGSSSPREIQGLRKVKAVNCGENHSAVIIGK